MVAKAKRAEDKAARLLETAREIIRETGDFELPMRTLAARAQVSLRTPYELFGSKNGVIRAILKTEQAMFRESARQLSRDDWFDNLLSRNHLSVLLYRSNQPFYRALFRATQAYSGGAETEPAREVVATFRILCQRAQAAGLMRAEVDTDLLAEVLTDLFAAEFRNWAASSFDIGLVEFKVSFGMAAVLAAVATSPHDGRMRRRMLEFQSQLKAMESGSSVDVSVEREPPPAEGP